MKCRKINRNTKRLSSLRAALFRQKLLLIKYDSEISALKLERDNLERLSKATTAQIEFLRKCEEKQNER